MTVFGRLSDYQAGLIFDDLMTLDWWGAIFGSDPLTADPLTVEVLGASYARPSVTKERFAFNLIRNSNLLVFSGLAPGTHIYAVGAFDAPTNGNLIAAAPYPSIVTIDSGGTWTLAETEFQVGLDVVLGP